MSFLRRRLFFVFLIIVNPFAAFSGEWCGKSFPTHYRTDCLPCLCESACLIERWVLTGPCAELFFILSSGSAYLLPPSPTRSRDRGGGYFFEQCQKPGAGHPHSLSEMTSLWIHSSGGPRGQYPLLHIYRSLKRTDSNPSVVLVTEGGTSSYWGHHHTFNRVD